MVEYCTEACTLRNQVVWDEAGTLSAAAWQGESISFRSGFAGSKAVNPVAKYLRMPIWVRSNQTEDQKKAFSHTCDDKTEYLDLEDEQPVEKRRGEGVKCRQAKRGTCVCQYNRVSLNRVRGPILDQASILLKFKLYSFPSDSSERRCFCDTLLYTRGTIH